MAYQTINIEEQLWRLSQGKPTSTPVEVLAYLAASRMARQRKAQRKANAAPRGDANAFLANLLRLPDTRTDLNSQGRA
jgi:hypothetical protein